MAEILVVGYGNDLRSDDGAGRRVADRIEELDLDGVEVKSMAQLTPEVALVVAGRRLVVFVDASVDVTEMTVTDVRPGAGDGAGARSVMTHHGDPATVLAMAGTVGEPTERAVLVSIPASNLEMGFDLSPATASAADDAVTAIAALIDSARQ